MPNLNSIKTALAVCLTNMGLIYYSVYFDLVKLHFPYSHGYLAFKSFFAILPVFYIFLFKKIDIDKKIFHLSLFWTTYCALSIHFIAVNYGAASIQVAIAFIGFFFLDRKEFAIFFSYLFAATIYTLSYSPALAGFGQLNADLRAAYLDDVISVLFLTGICYAFYMYPRIKKVKEDLQFSGIGKASSFIIHEIQKPLNRMQEKNIHDEDISKLKKTIDVARQLQDHSFSRKGSELINLNQTCESIVSTYQSYIDYLNIKVIYNVDQDNFHTDASSLSLILDNLIRNSIEANKENKTDGRWITINSSKNKVWICNPYVTTLTKDDIFKPLKSTKPGNMGIGLHICKTIAEAHGNSIDIQLKDNIFYANLYLK